MTKLLETVNHFVWGIPALLLILFVGIWLTIRIGAPQVILFPRALQDFLHQFTGKRAEDPNQVSGYQALCTALAATVGTGNIIGVAGAISIGGPGAVFWMWVCAFLGMATKYAEATLSVRYHVRSQRGEWSGGPMYMMELGLGKKWLAKVYCIFGVIAAFGVGNVTQIRAIIDSIDGAVKYLGITPFDHMNLVVATILALLLGIMLMDGAVGIGKVAQRLVPFAAAAYILLCVAFLVIRIRVLPEVLYRIVAGAFTPQAVTGGMIGSFFQALRIGASRGVFTNEAGMGTAAIAHGGADVSHPARQGLMGIMEVFIDTIVICSMTALVILSSGISIDFGKDLGAYLTGQAFSTVYGGWVHIFLAAALCAFGIATVLGWGLYGARCAQYLFGDDFWEPFVLIQVVFVVLGGAMQTDCVWLLAETVNGLMAIPNLVTLICLTPELRRITDTFRFSQGGTAAQGGTYENIHQRKSLRTVPHAKIPSPGGQSGKAGKENLSSEHR